MRFGRDLDRRTFLKLGAAGTAAAAIIPSIGGSSVGAKRTLSSPPTLVDMAADRLTYRQRLRDQGAIGQAHFVEDVYPPVNGRAFKSSEDAPFIEDWSCVAAAPTELVI